MSLIDLSHRVTQADIVLGIIQLTMNGREIAGTTMVDRYVNGREQGYSIRVDAKTTMGVRAARRVSFSEYRCSDNIVVYFGDPMEFEYNTNIPQANIYAGARMFDYRDFNGAADFIVGYLFEDIPLVGNNYDCGK